LYFSLLQSIVTEESGVFIADLFLPEPHRKQVGLVVQVFSVRACPPSHGRLGIHRSAV